jgi:hypothetical protein
LLAILLKLEDTCIAAGFLAAIKKIVLRFFIATMVDTIEILHQSISRMNVDPV